MYLEQNKGEIASTAQHTNQEILEELQHMLLKVDIK